MHSLARVATCERYVVQPTAMDWGEQDWDKTRRRMRVATGGHPIMCAKGDDKGKR